AAQGFDSTGPTLYGTVNSIESANGVDLVIGGTNAGDAGLTAATTTGSLVGVTIADTTIATADGANDAIDSIDAALSTINTNRASLGAIQNRFESVVASIQATSENLSASRSRIRDADFAAETAELVRVQILQQAGISMLSQANAHPQSVLSLLQ
ncbi:MAG: flagellin, partial [Gammaproteobacteria bacterium]|nr:flagellin [Gammaproteobacteria bacterium]